MKKFFFLLAVFFLPMAFASHNGGYFPHIEGWYVGDAHIHSSFGTTNYESPDHLYSLISEANRQGLDWVIITEHSVAFDKGTYLYGQGVQTCSNYSEQENFLCMYAQEFSVYAGPQKQQHLLGLPLGQNFLPYIDGTCNDLLQLDNCRQPQEVIDELNVSGGMGFISHPFHKGIKIENFTGLVYFDWVNWNVSGYQGIEVFNGSEDDGWSISEQQSFEKWQELLLEETNPADGFVVGIGNSDAHHANEFGTAFTYCFAESLNEINILRAYKNGNCVLSNGPIVDAAIDNSRIGEIAQLTSNTAVLKIHSKSNENFGQLKTLSIYTNGQIIQQVNLDGYESYSEISLNLSQLYRYLIIKVETTAGKVAVTNPLWLDFSGKTGSVFIKFDGFPKGKTKDDVKIAVESAKPLAKWFGNKLILFGLVPGKEYDVVLNLSGTEIKLTGLEARTWDKLALVSLS